MLIVRQQHSVPESIRALSPISDPDYIDCFTLSTNDSSPGSPEQRARAAFEEVAGLQGQFIWRVLLGLRLKWRAAASHIAGWEIADRGDGWVRLEAHSWMLTGHLVVLIAGHEVSLATVIRYHQPIAARLWSPLSAVHRRLAPDLLRDAHAVQLRPEWNAAAPSADRTDV
ncbi:hypothetical protein ACFV7Q_26985 [Streptomyces sp. NPDC059851]|uniref:hypothetical protein n=1 Tax=Streptomyces sp. NPDC059851 TaxID=3346971 RepID=UPI003666BC24